MNIEGKNTNYVQNRFFGKEINKYLSKNEIKKTGAPYYYYNIDIGAAKQCETCDITNQLTDLDFLGNKRKLYQNIIKEKPHAKSYLPFSIFFTKNNTEILKPYFLSNKTWIIKPENEMSGKGIFLAKSMDELKQGILKYPKLNNWLLQEYITPPLLYRGYKFHIRRYVLVNISQPNLELYLYKNGIMYISDKKFDDSNNNTSFLSGSGSLTFSEKQMLEYPDEYIQEFGSSLFNINRQMENIVVESIDSVSDRLRCPNSKNLNYQCYKLMGYDFLIDENHKVYLGEINVRIISIKFPPKDFKMKMYNDILDIVFYKKTTPDFKLLFVKKIPNEQFITENYDYQFLMAVMLICWWIYLFFD